MNHAENIMSAMQEFAKTDAKECFIIWTDESDNVCWSCTSQSFVVRLGMIEFVKSILVRRTEE